MFSLRLSAVGEQLARPAYVNRIHTPALAEQLADTAVVNSLKGISYKRTMLYSFQGADTTGLTLKRI